MCSSVIDFENDSFDPIGLAAMRVVSELVARAPTAGPGLRFAFPAFSTLAFPAEAEGVAVDPGGNRSTAALAVEGSAHGRFAIGAATVIEFVPRKGPGAGAPGQVYNEVSMPTVMGFNVKSTTTGTAGLGYRMRR